MVDDTDPTTASVSEPGVDFTTLPVRTKTGPANVEGSSRLEEGQIRLLSLELREDVLYGQLSIWSLDELPDYAAISYTWGEDPPSVDLICDGSLLQITPHLAGALRQLIVSEKDCSLWWVDAVCIAQNDADEKAAQVRRIDEVFAGAKFVTIWWGEATPETELAIASLPRVVEALSGRSRDYSMTKSDWLTSLGLPTKEDPLWEAFRCLLENEWFCRVWTVQEALLNQRTIVYCGGCTCAFSDLIDHQLLLDAPVYFPRDDFDWLGALFPLSRALRERPPYLLHSVLDLAMGRKAKIPLDNVYGLMGLLHPNTRSSIPIDYSLAAIDDYHKTCALAVRIALAEDHGAITLLAGLPQKLVDPNLPFWCPNLACGRATAVIPFASKTITTAELLKLFDSSANAGTSPTFAEYSVVPVTTNRQPDDWNVLRITAVMVDEIVRVVHCPPRRGAGRRAWRRYLNKCYRIASSHHVDEDTFCRAWLAWPEQPDVPEQKFTSLQLQDLRVAVSEVWSAETPLLGIPGEMQYRWDLVWEKNGARCAFVVTKLGRIGIAVCEARRGDKVIVVPHADSAFLVRKRTDGNVWEFTYSAYLYGLMSGQVIDMISRGECDWEELDLV